MSLLEHYVLIFLTFSKQVLVIFTERVLTNSKVGVGEMVAFVASSCGRRWWRRSKIKSSRGKTKEESRKRDRGRRGDSNKKKFRRRKWRGEGKGKPEMATHYPLSLDHMAGQHIYCIDKPP